MSKVTTKRWKTKAASATAFADASAAVFMNANEEVDENVGGGSGFATVEMGGPRSTASLDIGREDLMDTAL